jgi:methionine-R-sulfoxide reductase
MYLTKSTNMRYPIFFFAVLVLSLQSCGQKPQTSSKNSETTKSDTTMDNQVKKTDEEWKKSLTPDQYYVLREKGTERPFTGKLLLTKDKGIYRCAACGNELFSSDMKFDSHCGWPSFDREIKGGKIITHTDTTFGMVRTEIMCARCGSHLGHIFDDGPTETGKRYCVNSVSLDFLPADSTEAKK